jgi:hypothetical protein
LFCSLLPASVAADDYVATDAFAQKHDRMQQGTGLPALQHFLIGKLFQQVLLRHWYHGRLVGDT